MKEIISNECFVEMLSHDHKVYETVLGTASALVNAINKTKSKKTKKDLNNIINNNITWFKEHNADNSYRYTIDLTQIPRNVCKIIIKLSKLYNKWEKISKNTMEKTELKPKRNKVNTLEK